LFAEYFVVFLVLIILEGLLSADNALVLAILVKPLGEEKQKKALLYGLIGAFIMRFSALFLISFLANVWQAQAIGALYLLYIAVKNLLPERQKESKAVQTSAKEPSFWGTVLKVELTDIAFAIDSILAAVAMAISLPPTGWGHIGGLDAGIFAVIFCGGFTGLIIMRFAAMFFIKILQKRPGLEKAAFLIVGWVGVKLVVVTLAHKSLAILPAELPESLAFKLAFFIVMFAIAAWGWFYGDKDEHKEKPHAV